MYQFETIVDQLLEKFPEFANSNERKEIYENDGAYIYLSYFGDFLLRELDRSEEGNEIIKRAFTFINEVLESDGMDSRLWDLFNIEIFDRLRMEKYQNMANQYLNGKALKAFQFREGRPA